MNTPTELRTPLLDGVYGPYDIRALQAERLPGLAQEIREFLVDADSRASGSSKGPGPNRAPGPGSDLGASSDLEASLGMVELTIALHRVFNSPRDPLLFDRADQSHVHEVLTGHRDATGRRARTALSCADGIARSLRLCGGADRHVVAVIDGEALITGVTWEALNSIAATADLPVVIVVNDRGGPSLPERGGLAERFLDLGENVLRRTPVVGRPLFGALHGVKRSLGEPAAPQGLFAHLGLTYTGPVDGHSVPELEAALRGARDSGGPAIVHCVTRAWTRLPQATGADPGHEESWISVFGEEMVKAGADRPEAVGVTAGTPRPAGLGPFAEVCPERVHDAGGAEQHAVASAAGLAAGGLHPVVAVGASFLHRALGQVLTDVAGPMRGVTFVVDGAARTEGAGEGQGGTSDLALPRLVPGLRIAVPRDGARLRAQLRRAIDIDDAPTAIHLPRGPVGPDIEAVGHDHGVDVLHRTADGPRDVLVVSVGAMAHISLVAAGLLEARGVGVTVVDPGWVEPLDPRVAELALAHRLVVTVEEGGRAGGVGAGLAETLNDASARVRVLRLASGTAEPGLSGPGLAQAVLTGPGLAQAVLSGLLQD
ncbi:1-deoxy-D-xylulose-5-phosphate synthase N-terminal domain-containing protein [Streptomyces sp. Je 1-332]|uniref:1-deoxy-D-xylulose-5-phosphate synthase N-terminal domain-containing protein n=1 Tax=Streptomyces sp. Je 1-332 TaxID=3231270 RepID=UPI00345AFE3E